ncbi:MAG: MoaD/ThiS family protein [Candidatus Bathyarchaeota archaeon]|nr:MAG: MoaD/ThiS family protein [Candidatus Bathyarchaeota archaeon]
MITVEVKLYASLRSYFPKGKRDEALAISLSDDVSLEQLYAYLNIPLEEVVVALVNGLARADNYVLQNSDKIDVFPSIAGG